MPVSLPACGKTRAEPVENPPGNAAPGPETERSENRASNLLVLFRA